MQYLIFQAYLSRNLWGRSFQNGVLTQHSKNYENYIFLTLMVGQKTLSH